MMRLMDEDLRKTSKIGHNLQLMLIFLLCIQNNQRIIYSCLAE